MDVYMIRPMSARVSSLLFRITYPGFYFVILNMFLGVSLLAVGSGFTLVAFKNEKPFLKATAAIPNAFGRGIFV